MSDLQPFRANDTTEPKIRDSALPELTELGDNLDEFWEGAFEAAPLGDVLWDLRRDPLAGVLTKEVFRSCFFAIHELFTRPGTFEFYLEVFRAIWGEAVAIEFVVPSPGVLLINIDAAETGAFNLTAREIVDDAYVFSHLITSDMAADDLIAQVEIGIKSQSDVDTLMKEISPGGIWVVADLTL